MKKVVKFITLGCKVNQYETNGMIQKFIQSGYQIVEHNQKADIYIVNTCTVTNMSDRKSRQMLRRMKEKNKNTTVVACRMLCTGGKKRITRNTRNRFSSRKQRKSKHCKTCRRIYKRESK